MARKKKYNIEEDSEMQEMFKEYFALREWWQNEQEKMAVLKKSKEVKHDTH